MRVLWQYRLTVALLLAIVAMSTSVYVVAKRSQDNAQAKHALCALRANLAHRGDQAVEFLREHPGGALGISRAVIVKSIRDTRSTLHALRRLDC